MILKMCLHLVAVFLGNLLRDVWQDLSAIDISWAEILYRKKINSMFYAIVHYKIMLVIYINTVIIKLLSIIWSS